MLIWWRVRRLLRSTTAHIEEHKAYKWDRRLRYAYIFFAWNAMCIGWYYTNRMKSDPNYKEHELTRSERWAKLVHSDNPTYVRIKGFTIVEKISKNDIDERNNNLNSSENS